MKRTLAIVDDLAIAETNVETTGQPEPIATMNGNGKENGRVPPFTWISGNQLSVMERRTKDMIIAGQVAKGSLTINSAKAKSGKTTLTVELCHAVATGRPALGEFAVIQGPVLYWLADDSNVERFSESWKLIAGDTAVENFHLCVARTPLYPEGVENLRKAAAQFQPVLVCIDSYTMIRTTRNRGSDFVKAEYNDMRRLSELAAETKSGFKLIHHYSKAKQDDPMDSAAGSYGISAGPDNRMVVEKLPGTERLVQVDGRDVDELQFVYARGADRKLFHVISGPAAKDWERIRKIAAKQRNTPFAAKDIGETFGLSDRQAFRIIRLWESIEAITEADRGRYLFTNTITAAVENLRQRMAA
jgi:hypothetical protein